MKCYCREAELTCGTDSTPMQGTACVDGPGTDTQHVCGQCGMLFDMSYPLGQSPLSNLMLTWGSFVFQVLRNGKLQAVSKETSSMGCWRGTFVMTLINHQIINKDDIPLLLFYIPRSTKIYILTF